MWDLLLTNLNAATMTPGGAPYGAGRDAAIAVHDGRIAWIGPRADLPDAAARETRDLEGRWVTPGLIDCHTHLVFGGNRAPEWERRLNGATYEEIARAGGGIQSTVDATRGASTEQLAEQALPRARALARRGVTTVEIKSGYGLEPGCERRMLEAAGLVGQAADLRVSRTLLAAHTVPKEYRDNRDAYVNLIIDRMIPQAASVADAVDAYCETIGFTPDEVDRIFTAARAHGLQVKLHAEQLSDQGGAALAARHQALSADHLEHLSPEGVAALAGAGTVAVLLPGAYYFLRDEKAPPVAALREAGVPMAVATDCNPGTSPLTDPLLAMNLACTLFRLTPEEALAGFTRNAARALGLHDRIGTLEPGKAADLAVWNIDEPAELAYWLGADLLAARYRDGRQTA
ncbi:imidazolonepropionase [Peiella sedimenti]|uniref:imidazolonepropionase n=1 Tax=Peiella sedimenti TaxID=3061083 RepID=UPI003CC754AC